jgi:hypothetical protein
MSLRWRAGAAVLLAGLLAVPAPAWAWGPTAVRLIANKAVDTLPQEILPFFEANRNYLVQHVTDPFDTLKKTPSERRNQFIHLDHYGQFPFTSLPRNYNSAVAKFTKRALDTQGLLPWEVGVYSARLTDAFKAHNWEEVRTAAAQLAFYVAQSHDPFNTTVDDDGKQSNQPGANVRFGTHLVDRYQLFFFVHPNEATYFNDPTDRAFEMCLSAHSWLENVLLAERRARRGINDYNDEYYDHFYSQAGAVLIRQISDAATDAGSYWLTAWVNAGRPQLPSR